MKKDTIVISGTLILMIIVALLPPILSLVFFDKFTYNLPKVMQEQQEREHQERYDELKEVCKWGVSDDRYGLHCQEAPCKKYNTKGLDCRSNVKYSGGFFSRKISDVTCDGYGDMLIQCSERYHSKEEYYKGMGFVK